VILNQVAGARHERVAREAIESVCGLPVLGSIPRATAGALVPTRHLGLVTPLEYNGLDAFADRVLEDIGGHLDFERIYQIARQALPLPIPAISTVGPATARGLTVGYLSDSAFTFYYPENLEALETAGARLASISALTASSLPPGLNALYIGGGFPETHARALSANRGFLASIRSAAHTGLPVYAECGGLMLLSRSLTWRGTKHEMAGVLPFEVEVCDSPQGHGYAELLVDSANPFFPVRTKLRGHEFHYSRLVGSDEAHATACAVIRGTGCLAGRDAVLLNNIWAAYTHLHASATPEWAGAMIRAARSALA
jgi:cobyrinic acid a,c-diamide synthase